MSNNPSPFKKYRKAVLYPTQQDTVVSFMDDTLYIAVRYAYPADALSRLEEAEKALQEQMHGSYGEYLVLPHATKTTSIEKIGPLLIYWVQSTEPLSSPAFKDIVETFIALTRRPTLVAPCRD